MADEKTIILSLEVKGISREAEALGDIDAELRRLNKTKREYLELEREQGTLSKQQLTDLNKVETQIRQLKTQRQGLNREESTAIKLEQSHAGSIGELRQRNSQLRAEMNKLNITTKEGQDRLKFLRIEYDKNNTAVRNFDRSISGSNTLVGEYSKGIGASFKTIGLAIGGAMAAWHLISNVFGGAVRTVKEFGTALSDLEAITGASGEDLEFLKQSAIELGPVYGKSATEIVNAMKLVGSAKPELLGNVEALKEMTESVLTLSQATGLDLERSTKTLAVSLNQYGESADQAAKYTNVLAAGSKFGSVEVDYLSDAISKVGSVANSANVSIEQLTSVMEILGGAGIEATTAGRGFRNILGVLQKDTANYTDGVFDLNKAIDNNQNIAGNNIVLQKKFGTEFYNLAQILLTNKERFNELTLQVTDTNVAFEQAAIKMDNLEGDVNKLSAAYDSMILSIESGDGVLSKLARGVVGYFTDVLNVFTAVNSDSGDWLTNMDNIRLSLEKIMPFSGLMKKILDPGDTFEKVEDAVAKRREAIEAEIKGNKALAQFEKEQAEEKKKSANEIAKISAEQSEKRAAAYRKEAEEKLKASNSFELEAKKINASLIEDAQSRKIAELNIWKEQEDAKIAISKASDDAKNSLLEANNRLYNEKLGEIYTENLVSQAGKDEEFMLAIQEHEKEHQAKLLEIKQEYGTDQESIDASRELELLALQENFGAELALTQEYKDAEAVILAKYRKLEVDEEKKKQAEKLKLALLFSSGAQRLLSSFGDFFEGQKQKELALAGENEAQKAAIEQKYARKSANIKLAQAIINAAQGITKIWAEWGAVPVVAAVLTGIEAVATGIQIATIRSQQFSEGGLVLSGDELPGSKSNQDNTLVMVKPKEVILNERQQAIAGGPEFFKRLGVPGFASGGIVGGIVAPTQNNSSLATESIVSGIAQSLQNIKVNLVVNELNEAQSELNYINSSQL
jgi:hypothetical protein